MAKKKQSSNQSPHHTSFARLDDKKFQSLVPDAPLDKLMTLLKLDPNETVTLNPLMPNFTMGMRDYLRREISYALILADKPKTGDADMLPKQLKKEAAETEKTLKNALEALKAMHYAQLDENSGTAWIAGQMRRESLNEWPRPWNIHTQGQGIDIVKKGNDSPILFPLDDHLGKSMDSIQLILRYLESVQETIPKPTKGRSTTKEMDELLIELCFTYWNVTKRKINFRQSHVQRTGERKVHGQIIDFLEVILPHTSYSGSVTREALHKRLDGIRTSTINNCPNIKPRFRYPEIWE